MNRREFFTASVIAGLAAVAPVESEAEHYPFGGDDQEYGESITFYLYYESDCVLTLASAESA